MKTHHKMVVGVASGFFTGYIPFAPGTFGTVLGLPACFLLSKIDIYPAGLCICGFILIAVWSSGRAQDILARKDPGCIVIDEISGMMVTLLGIAFTPGFVVSGFLLFRAFDILKPFPIGLIDRKMPGGAGIVADDVLAGIYANLIIRMFLYIGG